VTDPVTRGTADGRPPKDARGTDQRGTKMLRRPSACEQARGDVYRLVELLRATDAAIQHERSALSRARSEPVGLQCWVASEHGPVQRDCAELRTEIIERHDTRLNQLLARRTELAGQLAAARARVERDCAGL